MRTHIGVTNVIFVLFRRAANSFQAALHRIVAFQPELLTRKGR
ncbi:hypothetical protein SJA_C1-33350 [Sphingobium indicum UT26S]|uniref:Uncharacterized protein n=1 Tax=Sphingobium indicum (strain DSM 16413 / CCM 7287 / MTCC 6362 / UT26 / NBRC 101211 / UT26S) TaxID=452662 RepID=D4Z6D7_SPHIU|nr:hypothetical protein SJA_C1-33350 [Sphingobium indicum UT26S]